MNYQLLERQAKPESSLPGLRTREAKTPMPEYGRQAPSRVDPAPAPAPAPAATTDAPAKRKPGRPRKVVS